MWYSVQFQLFSLTTLESLATSEFNEDTFKSKMILSQVWIACITEIDIALDLN